jgi:hypothetical protein
MEICLAMRRERVWLNREREVRGGRVESLWSDGRLSRDLEEGFKDDSEEEVEEERRGRT